MIRIVSLYYFFHWSNVQWFCKLISILILFGSLWRFRHGKRYFEAWFFLLYFFLLWNLLLWLFLILTCQLCKLKLRCSYGFSINKAGLLWSKEGTGWGKEMNILCWIFFLKWCKYCVSNHLKWRKTYQYEWH